MGCHRGSQSTLLVICDFSLLLQSNCFKHINLSRITTHLLPLLYLCSIGPLYRMWGKVRYFRKGSKVDLYCVLNYDGRRFQSHLKLHLHYNKSITTRSPLQLSNALVLAEAIVYYSHNRLNARILKGKKNKATILQVFHPNQRCFYSTDADCKGRKVARYARLNGPYTVNGVSMTPAAAVTAVRQVLPQIECSPPLGWAGGKSLAIFVTEGLPEIKLSWA